MQVAAILYSVIIWKNDFSIDKQTKYAYDNDRKAKEKYKKKKTKEIQEVQKK